MVDYFKFEELIASNVARLQSIDNLPDPVSERNLRLCIPALNLLRHCFGHPIRVNSGYRCKKLNTLVGGADASYHLIGLAFDLSPIEASVSELHESIVSLSSVYKAFTNRSLFREIVPHDTYIHIAFNPETLF